ncbi:MAG: hypothetical protein WC381_08085 [Kiritimatiellia bacterium]|jgi:hypothetical protein
MATNVTIAEIKATAGDLERARGAAREFAAKIRAHFGGLKAARGDWTAESGVDLLVLLDRVELADEDWLASRALKRGILGSGFMLQPLFMAEANFNELVARERLFAREVQRDGIDL